MSSPRSMLSIVTRWSVGVVLMPVGMTPSQAPHAARRLWRQHRIFGSCARVGEGVHPTRFKNDGTEIYIRSHGGDTASKHSDAKIETTLGKYLDGGMHVMATNASASLETGSQAAQPIRLSCSVHFFSLRPVSNSVKRLPRSVYCRMYCRSNEIKSGMYMYLSRRGRKKTTKKKRHHRQEKKKAVRI